MLAVAHTQRVLQQTTGSLSALVIFAKFQGEVPGQNEKPTWADDIFDRQLEGSFAHFYETMSRGQLQVRGEVLPKRYSSQQPAAAYVADAPGTLGKFGQSMPFVVSKSFCLRAQRCEPYVDSALAPHHNSPKQTRRSESYGKSRQ